MVPTRLVLVALLALCGIAFDGAPAATAQPALAVPAAPLCLAAGQGVHIAWSLPAGPRPANVVIYRAEKDAEAFLELTRVDAARNSYTDESVELGRQYHYRVETLRGGDRSGMSPATNVLVGGSARVLLRGGSLEKAVFEVTLFRAGRKLASTFAHGPGEKVGDLVHVPELQRIEDFRLGLTLRELSLSRARTEETGIEELKQASGETLKDLGGRPIKLEFRFPAGDREVLTAALALKDGRIISLTEGTAFVVP